MIAPLTTSTFRAVRGKRRRVSAQGPSVSAECLYSSSTYDIPGRAQTHNAERVVHPSMHDAQFMGTSMLSCEDDVCLFSFSRRMHMLCYKDQPVVVAEVALWMPSAKSTRKTYALPAYPNEYGGIVRMLGFLPLVSTTGGKSAVALDSDTTVQAYVLLPFSTRGRDTSVRMVSWRPRQCFRDADPAICIPTTLSAQERRETR